MIAAALCQCHRERCRLAADDPRHGTAGGYTNHYCGCEACTRAKRLYHTAWRRGAASRPTPDHVHGTANGYNNYGCRCEGCRAAWAKDVQYSRSRNRASA